MSRLTKYEPRKYSMFPYQLKDDELSTKLDSIHKLGQLEDLEEELGCPLDVVFKALKEGIIVCDDDNIDVSYKPIEISLGVQLYLGKLTFVLKNFDQVDAVICDSFGLNYFPDFWLLKDYQKTWWLKGDKQ